MSFDPAQTITELRAWDVVYPYDDRIHPKKHKMWVCASKANLWFFRINTRTYDACCVPLLKAQNPFLVYDSFLRCGGDLVTVSEIELESLLAHQNDTTKQDIIGSINPSDRALVCHAIRLSPLLTPAQLRVISHELGCP